MAKNFDPNYQPVIVHYLVGQKVVVFNDRNEILFLRRSSQSKRAGGWDFPGGGLEKENPEAGIKREAMEEANIEIREVMPISVIAHDRENSKDRTLIIGYSAQLASGEVQLSWEHDHFKWLSIKEALQVDLPEGHRKFLETAIELSKNTNIPKSQLVS